MKRFFSLLLALTLVVGMMSAFTVSAAVNTTTFYNAATNEIITSLDDVDSIYATTTFTGRYEDNASVIASHYDLDGKLTKVEFINPVGATIGAEVSYTTPTISVADTDIVKIFAWTGVETLKPLLKFPGVISRSEDIALPTATVSSLNVGEITEVPLTFAMNFKADPVSEAQLLAYGNWYADFELKVNKDVTFNLDGTADGYLAGQYDSWSPAWVTVPKKAVTLPADTALKIMETGAETYGQPGLKYTYGEVFDRVKDFDCGVFFTQEFLEANPDLHVTLELRMYNPLNEEESYLIGETHEFTCTLPTTTVTVLNAEELGLDYALNFVANEVTEGQLSAYADWKADYVLTVNKDFTLNADGTKDAYLSGQYDEFGPEWVNMPATETAITANEAVSVLGLYGKTVTFRDVVETVKDFDCGIKFSDSFLAANPDLEAKLELRLYHPSNNGAYYVIGESFTFKQQQNITEEAQVLTQGNVTAEVPAGVLLNKGVTELALTTTALENSESGVEAGANESLSAMDVHVEGVSEENTTPIIVTLKEATEKGYNKGNLSLFHVEDGEAVKMEEVETKEDLVAHNQFTYDPADGTIAVALANFSEIAMLSDDTKAWNGALDFEWYTSDRESYTIANADQLAAFGALVGGMAEGYERDSFEDKTVKLISDINLNDAETNNQSHIFHPIGYYFTPDQAGDGTNVAYSTVYSFEGTFDGNGHTVANFYQNTWEIKGDYNDGYPAGSNYYKDGFGLFGYVYNGTVKNLIVSNFSSDGEFTPTGIVAAYAGGESTFENINVFDCTPRVYQTADGGIVGMNSSKTEKCKLTFRNITVDQSNTLSALWGNWGLAAGNIMGWLRGNPENEVIMENCHAAAVMDVNNDICGNYHWYLYRFAGMYIGTIENLIEDTDGRLIPDLSGITAIDCTATFGSWNEYWYCELVENTIASYTHDHQFSRLERISDLSEIQDASGNWLRTGNFVIATDPTTDSAVCYHVIKDADGNLYEHKHDVADELNPNIYEDFDLNGDGLLNDLKEDRQHYYVPFNQLFNGYGEGIKPIYNVNSIAGEADPYPNIDITIEESDDMISQEKFRAKEIDTIAENATVLVGDLFAVSGQGTVSGTTVQVYVSPASEDSTVSAVYAAGVPDWKNGTLTFSGTGLARITITDYYYCTPTIAYVEVGAEDPVDKFVAKENLTFTHTTEGGTIEATLGDIFQAIEGAEIDSAAVEVTVDNEAVCTYVKNDADWTQSTVSFTGTGTVIITVTDGELCNVATATVTVDNAASVDKFIPNTGLTYQHTMDNTTVTKTLGELFTAAENTNIISEKVTVTVTGNAVVTENTADWTQTTIAFNGAGIYTVTVTDHNFCNVATATVTVTEPDAVVKFAKKFDQDFLYRVGNKNTVTLGNLFGYADNTVPMGTVSVTIDTITGASGTYTSNATWTNGTIQFTGTGVVKVTITDDLYCIPTELYLEVVDATNVTSLGSISGQSVVLLNNCGLGQPTITAGSVVYGNGFKVSTTTDAPALDLGSAFLTLTDSTLDNVKIVAPNFSHAHLYKSAMSDDATAPQIDGTKTRYYNTRAAVIASGNSKIINSYVSGGRVAIYASDGDILVDNTTVYGGATANIQMGSVNGLTLRDVTMIQEPIQANVNVTTKTVMGLSFLAMADADGNTATVTLEGDFVQYAWAQESYKTYVPSEGQSVVANVLKETDYIHSITYSDETTADSVNLGFAYMPYVDGLTIKQANPTINDYRTNKSSIPYELIEVSSAKIYTYKNSNGTDDSYATKPAYLSDSYEYVPATVTYSGLNTDMTFDQSFDVTKGGWHSVLDVQLNNAYTLDFGKLKVQKHGKDLAYTVSLNGQSVDKATPVEISAGTTCYTLTIIDNSIYDANGNLTSQTETYTYNFYVVGVETAKDSPSLVATNYEAGLCVASSKGGTWHGAAPALKGIQIRYWSVAEGQYKTITLSDVITVGSGKLNGTSNYWTYTHTNNDFTLKITNPSYVQSSNKVYAMPVGVEDDLYFTPSSSNGLVNTGNSARAIPLSYEFTDNNGGTTLTFSHSWSIEEDQNNEYSYSDFCNGTKTLLTSGGCVTPDTLITLADGSQVRVDSLTGDEELLVWNLETGSLDSAPIMFVDSDEEAEVEVVTLTFSDGTDVKVIYEHGFWDYDLNRYVYLDENASEYIGHTFAKHNGDTLEKVQLTDVALETEVTTAWSPVTKGHLCYFVNGMLSMPGGVGGLFNIFEVDSRTMTYDYEKMAEDIETYGLFTYEELNEIAPLSEAMFEEAGGAYLKISIGKDNLTMEELVAMINRYSKFFE